MHAATLGDSLQAADLSIIFQPDDLGWNVEQAVSGVRHVSVSRSLDAIVARLAEEAQSGDHIVVMSNGSFGGLHQRVAERLAARA